MKEVFAVFRPDIPEQCKVVAYVSGHKGGDAGHGAEAIVEFSPQSGACHLEVELNNGKSHSFEWDIKSVSLSMFGDWEMEGLAFALIEIGQQLLDDPTVRKDYLEYKRGI